MRRWGLVIVLALVCPTVVSASPAPPRGTIAFTLGVDIWAVTADGTRRMRLTRGGFGSQPSWSPDGKRLLFVGRKDLRLRVMRVDGSEVRTLPPLANLAGASDPDWARDGRTAFVGLSRSSPCCRPDGIWVMNEDGSDRRFLVSGFGPAWSPDGSRIAFTDLVGDRAVAVIDARGGPPLRIAAGSAPAWSPDGRRLVFVDPGGGITVASADGGEARTVVDCGRAPAWSPDGGWLAYLSCRRDFGTRLYIVPSSGGTPTRLTRDAGPYGAPDWQAAPGSPAAATRASLP